MPISQKIIDRVEATTVSPEEKKLMMKILQIEDNGIFRYEAEYGVCAFASADGICRKPSRAWKKKYNEMKG